MSSRKQPDDDLRASLAKERRSTGAKTLQEKILAELKEEDETRATAATSGGGGGIGLDLSHDVEDQTPTTLASATTSGSTTSLRTLTPEERLREKIMRESGTAGFLASGSTRQSDKTTMKKKEVEVRVVIDNEEGHAPVASVPQRPSPSIQPAAAEPEESQTRSSITDTEAAANTGTSRSSSSTPGNSRLVPSEPGAYHIRMVSSISPPGLSRSSNTAAGRASDGNAPGNSSSRYRQDVDDDDVDIRIPEAFAVEDDPAAVSGGGGSDSSEEEGATALKGDVVHAATAVQTKTYCGVTLPSSNWKILGAVFGAVLILVAIIVGCLSATGKLGGAGTDTGTVAESSSTGNLVCPASKLIASDVATEEDRFGYSVALSTNVAIVGAYWSDSTKVTSNSGAAYVFELVSDPNSLDGRLAWVETAKLTIDEPEIDDKFGVEVAIGLEGNMLVVAADAKDEKTGSVYIFERSVAATAAATSAVAGNGTNNGTFATWTMSATLRPDDVVPGDNFGDSVAMDGTTLVVTAGNRPTGGLAYVYTFTDENKWEIQAQLQPDVPTNEKDKFGGSVAISGDTIVIGAMKTDDRTGAAYVYVRSGNSWTQQAMLFAEDGGYLYEFGNVVDIDRAGETIVVGSWKTPNKDIEEVGSVYVFTRQGSTWVQQAQITPSDAIVEKRRFGTNVVINADGNMMLISDYFNNERRGSVYQYSLSGDTWELEKILHPPGLEPGDHYGFSMAMHESSTGKANALIGEYGDSDVAFSSGAAWHIELCDSTR